MTEPSKYNVCPRRREIGAVPSNYPSEDEWRPYDGFLHCSYCGSIHPNELIQLMQTGGNLDPTDKSYKVYVKKQDGRWGKFYFQHLDSEQRQTFIDLYNAESRTFTMGFPGHFYVLPFFADKRPDA